MEAVTLTNEDVLREYRRETDAERKAVILDTFTRDNYRFITFIACKKMKSVYLLTEEERISSASFGFVKAIQTFNSEKGIKFATYAARCMANEILMELRRTTRKKHQTISLQDIVKLDEKNRAITLEDMLSSSEVMGKDFENQEILEQAWEVIQHRLSDREMAALQGYLRGDKQYEVATQAGTTQSYISRLQSRVLRKVAAIGKLVQGDAPILTARKEENTKEIQEHKELVQVNHVVVKHGQTAGMVKHLKETYPHITVNQISRILGKLPSNIKNYVWKYNKGYMDDIECIAFEVSAQFLRFLEPKVSVEDLKRELGNIQKEQVPLSSEFQPVETVDLVAKEIAKGISDSIDWEEAVSMKETSELEDFQTQWEQTIQQAPAMICSDTEELPRASTVTFEVKDAYPFEIRSLISMVKDRLEGEAEYDFTIALHKRS